MGFVIFAGIATIAEIRQLKHAGNALPDSGSESALHEPVQHPNVCLNFLSALCDVLVQAFTGRDSHVDVMTQAMKLDVAISSARILGVCYRQG